MIFTADLELFGKTISVECFVRDGEITDIIDGERDYSDLLKVQFINSELHKQLEDYKANLKAGV